MSENTRDLSKFGYVELKEAARLLTAYTDSDKRIPMGDGVAVEFNPNSGVVFLTDKDLNVAVMHEDKLVYWHYCSNCGAEGVLEDFVKHGKESGDCQEAIADSKRKR